MATNCATATGNPRSLSTWPPTRRHCAVAPDFSRRKDRRIVTVTVVPCDVAYRVERPAVLPEDALSQRGRCCGSAVAHVEFAVDRPEVTLHRLVADHQFGR